MPPTFLRPFPGLLRTGAVSALLLGPLGAQTVLVRPDRNIIYPHGPRCFFEATVVGSPDQRVAWEVTNGPGAIDPRNGEFHPVWNPEERLRIVTVRASMAGRPGVWGEGSVTVASSDVFDTLSHGMLETINRHAPSFLPYLLEGFPWQDPESGISHPGIDRFATETDGGLASDPRSPASIQEPTVRLAWGLPGYFSLKALPDKGGTDLAAWTLLSVGEPGGRWVCTNVSGRAYAPVEIRDGLEKIAKVQRTILDGARRLATHRRLARIRLTGVLPFCGRDGDPGNDAGAGLKARFTHPSGLALTDPGPDGWRALVSDDQAHVLRAVSAEGRAWTLAGRAGEAGLRDGACGQARFSAPTFLASRAPARAREGWLTYVSDTGNHVIRRIQGGRVTTYAGTGAPGAADAQAARDAAFSSPEGLALDPEGNLYVADSGNRAIRKIDAAPPHKVSTLWTDAAPDRADMKGLAYLPPGRLALAEGRRVMLLDIASREMECAVDAAETLAPWGLAATARGLLISDEGGHCVRFLAMGGSHPDPQRHASLETVAGDPSLPRTRGGTLRPSGLLPPGPLRRFAGALGAPRCVLPLPGTGDTCLVSEGTSLFLLSGLNGTRALPPPRFLDAPEAVAGSAPFRVRFRPVPPCPGTNRVPEGPFHWALDLVDAGDRVLDSAAGVDFGPASLARVLTPGRPGAAALRLSVLSMDGLSCAVVRRPLEILPGKPGPAMAGSPPSGRPSSGAAREGGGRDDGVPSGSVVPPAPEGDDPDGFLQAWIPDGRDLLRKAGFRLDDAAFLRIIQDHFDSEIRDAASGGPCPSRFLDACRPRNAFWRMLAAGLASPLETDPVAGPGAPRRAFLCRAASEVGSLAVSEGLNLRTSSFTVIAEREGNAGPWRIVTAYPVPPMARERTLAELQRASF